MTPVDGGEIAFESYGARVSVTFDDPALHDRVSSVLPYGHWRCPAAGERHVLGLVSGGDGRFDVLDGGEPVARSVDLDSALGVLDAYIRTAVARGARERVFVHAGVVAHEGGAILVPGRTRSGKTTLVAALVRAGATYYSDEFAVLDDGGLVHPYPKPLELREEGDETAETSVEALGGVQGREPAPARLVLITSYRPGAAWEPRRCSAGRGALVLMANTLPARDRPEHALAATRRAAEGAVVLESERGEADEVAARLLAAH